jgi:trimethylamine--corrinoid protein Co-methyltransferase
MAKRFIRGIEVNPLTLARDLIEKVGPGGHFIQEDHTHDHFRDHLWMPTLLTRQQHDMWQQEGAKTMEQRVQEKVRGIIESHQAPSLPDKTLAALEKLKQQGDAELSSKT